MAVTEQELVVHVFAHAAGAPMVEAAEAVMGIWNRCRDELGMTDPVPRLGLPVEPLLPATGSGPIGGRQRPDRDAQALLRVNHDILNLSMFVGGVGVSWPDLERAAARVVGTPTWGIVGVAWLYLGKADGEVAAELPEAVGVDGRGGWWRYHREFGPGLRLWECSPWVDQRAERRLVVLAPPEQDNDLSIWTWSDGDAAMPPLARYLMHMAKVRFEMRVHSELPDIGELSARTDEAVGLARSRQDGARLRAVMFDLGRQLTVVRMLRRTVDIARWNAAQAIKAAAPGPDEDDPFGDDRAVTEFLLHRLDDDIAYLTATVDGARLASDLLAVRATPAGAVPAPGPVFGIITALPEEFAAIRLMLDDGCRRQHVDGDNATYVTGTVPSADPDQPHSLVVTQLGETGNSAAAEGCANLMRSFPTVTCVLMVGIAAGVPTPTVPATHVRLGDIVVASWGIVDYDHVVDTSDGVALRQPHPRPSPRLGHVAKFLVAEERLGNRPWEEHIDAVVATVPAFARPPQDTDLVYDADTDAEPVPHPDPLRSGHRSGRPKVHHGRIGSADRSLRNLGQRDELAARYNLRAIEMEGSGVGKSSFANGVEWYVVRGISDYGDRRTGNRWRDYASLAAAAYVKALLGACFPKVRVRDHESRGHGSVRHV